MVLDGPLSVWREWASVSSKLYCCIYARKLFVRQKKKNLLFALFGIPHNKKMLAGDAQRTKKMKQNLILLHIGSKMIVFCCWWRHGFTRNLQKNATDSYSIQRWLVDWRWLRNIERKWGGQHSTIASFLLSDSVAEGSNPSIPKFFQRNKLSMLLRWINGVA